MTKRNRLVLGLLFAFYNSLATACFVRYFDQHRILILIFALICSLIASFWFLQLIED